MNDARKAVIGALSEGQLRAYPAPEVGDSDARFFERAVVLGLWPEEPVAGPLEATAWAPQEEAPAGADASSGNQTVPKRKGGRRAPWVKELRKYLKLRLDRGHDIQSMSLTELRRGFSSYATQHRIEIPKARSNLDTQIKKLRLELAAELQQREQRGHDTDPSISEIMRPPGIRSK
jgi:hypothetical protein